MSRTNPQLTHSLAFENKAIGKDSTDNSHFETARLEYADCLEALSNKLNTEISNITSRIEQFRSALAAQLTQQLYSLHQDVIRVVEEAFKNARRQVEHYILKEEKRVASEVILMRQQLDREYIKVEDLKGQLESSNWRKAMG